MVFGVIGMLSLLLAWVFIDREKQREKLSQREIEEIMENVPR